MGIDLVGYGGIATEGRQVVSPFTGSVVWIRRNAEGFGNSIVIRYDDHATGQYYFVRYMHFQDFAHREDIHGNATTPLAVDNIILAGDVVGRVGGTGGSRTFDPHLHMEVFRRSTPRFIDFQAEVAHRSNSIDPRAFYSPNFAEPWAYY